MANLRTSYVEDEEDRLLREYLDGSGAAAPSAYDAPPAPPEPEPASDLSVESLPSPAPAQPAQKDVYSEYLSGSPGASYEAPPEVEGQ